MLSGKQEGFRRAEVLTWLLIFSPFMDVINGWLMMNGRAGNVSSFYKIIILVYAFFLILRKTDIKLLVFVYLLAFSFFFQMLFLNAKTGLSGNDYAKLLFPVVLLFVFKDLDSEEKNNCIHTVLQFYCWFYPLSILIPTVLGIGFHTYGTDGFGFKGFYYAGNELAGVMLILLAYTFQCYASDHQKKNLFLLFLMMFTCIIIGMKSLYLGMIVLVVAFIIHLARGRNTIFWFVPTVILVGVLLVFMLKSEFIKDFILVQKARFTYRIKGMYENEFLAFMLSGRNDTVIKSFQGLWKYGGVLGILWGIGMEKSIEIAGKITEMDFFDLFLWNGLLAAIWYFYLLGTELLRDFKSKNKFAKIGILLLIAFAFLAGHVFYAPSVMIPIVLVCFDSAVDGI